MKGADRSLPAVSLAIATFSLGVPLALVIGERGTQAMRPMEGRIETSVPQSFAVRRTRWTANPLAARPRSRNDAAGRDSVSSRLGSEASLRTRCTRLQLAGSRSRDRVLD